MKKIVLLRSIIILLVLVLGYESYSYINDLNNSKENKVLEEIQISDNLKESKQIAIMQQKEDFTWEDKGTSASAWPDIKTFEYYGSECTDASGNNITPTTDVIQFDEQNQTATISTSKTIYCTLSFARKSKVLELMTKTTDETYLKTYDGKTVAQLEQGATTEDELLRYRGTYSQIKNNYICFGTENIDTCTQNPDTYMYRIIGITTDKVNTSLGLEANQLKIIKATPSNTSQTWASGNIDYDWDNTNATARIYLNGTFLSSITGSVGTHQWTDLISEPKWYKGDHNTSSMDNSIITNEKKSITTGNYKIGLMYASDYYNSWNYKFDSSNNYVNTNSWLFITNGLSSSSNTYRSVEWTMTRRAAGSVWLVSLNPGGGLSANPMDWPAPAVRPVFYLTRDISISGEGTEASPFIISDKIVSE